MQLTEKLGWKCNWAFHSMFRTLDPVPRKEGRDEGNSPNLERDRTSWYLSYLDPQQKWLEKNPAPMSSCSWTSRVQRNDRNAEGWERKGPHCSESFKVTVWFSVTSVTHWMWPQCTLQLHRRGCVWKNQCSVSECPYWANRNGTFQKKTLNFRADIIVNDFLPHFWVLWL